MVDYSGIFKFKGTWRNYQARVLKNAQKYKKDNRIHIVAAPGSGKTTLGIELMVRMGEPALVLAPSITIREQWVARITDAFLCEGVMPQEYLSQDLKNPKAITVVTYQSLHSAMKRYKGQLVEGEEGEGAQEEVDYSEFELIKTLKEAGIKVLCLDECHHLRSEWWKALEDFRQEMGDVKIIALTATPPYDSTPALWKRYMDMCGEIDEEITIPELVKEGSLCPHQDFVYFNYPTREEEAEVARFEERSNARLQWLMADETFLQNIKKHPCLSKEDTGATENMFQNPAYFTAFMIYLKEKGVVIPSRLKRHLGTNSGSKMDAQWMEYLLQGFLYEDAEAYSCKEYQEQLEATLKAEGLIEKRKVSLTVSSEVEKLLMNSKGKCKSIREIVKAEAANMKDELRLLILTDYIRKEYEPSIGNPEADVTALGVLPFFEQLRREVSEEKLRLGVLCGTIVIIPAEAKSALEEAVKDTGKVTFSPIGQLSEQDYLKVTAVGDAHFLTGAVTEIFTKGYMQVLIGTKSLLGEGWDSPCINSLILASFVGSFMLSNQMRGRAIRVFKEQPDKSSNIWHLVCLKSHNIQAETARFAGQKMTAQEAEAISEDFALLSRRMEHFLGLHYTEDVIENGMERLSFICPPYNQENVTVINSRMLELAGKRDELKARWNRSLAKYRKLDIVDETTVQDARVTKAAYKEALSKTAVSGGLGGAMLAAGIAGALSFASIPAGILGVAGLITALIRLPKMLSLNSPGKRLKACAEGVKNALNGQNLLEEPRAKVVAENALSDTHSVYLSGGSAKDKELFSKCISEMFRGVDDARYLLVKQKNYKSADGIYCVPACFSRRKEDAERFQACMKPYIGEYELVYTRNEKGKEFLLEAGMQALERESLKCVSHKKVKSGF